MKILRGLGQANGPCALTIGSFDGVHRGHQAMLALLVNEARHRGLPSCVLSFEPHPRDFFFARRGAPSAPARIATLRDKLAELARCGIDHALLLRFDERLAALSPQDFITHVLVQRLGARYVLVGDDFRFGARRAGDAAGLRCESTPASLGRAAGLMPGGSSPLGSVRQPGVRRQGVQHRPIGARSVSETCG